MNKKAQAEKLFVWILAIIMAALILFFGYNAVSKTTQTGCMAQLVLFEKSFVSDIESMYTQQGSVAEKNYNVPCGIDRIYFVDIDKDVSFSPLVDYPEIMDSLNGTDKNVFLIKGNEVYRSFSGGDIEIAIPYFDCYITNTGALSLFLEGKKGGTGILKENFRFDCTFAEPVPVELDPVDLGNFLEDIGEGSRTDDCDVARSISKEGGDTVITIIKSGEECRYFEEIPKCAIDSLMEAIDNGEIELENADIFSDDPLIMWDFETKGSATEIYRLLNQIVDDDCRRKFKGAPVEIPEITEQGNMNTGLEIEGKIALLQGGEKIVAENYLENIKKFWKSGKRDKSEHFIEKLEELLEESLDELREGLY